MCAAKPCEPYNRNDDQDEGQQSNEARFDDKPGVAACIRESVSGRSTRRVYRDGGQENRQSQHGKDDQRKQDDADDDFRAIGWCDGARQMKRDNPENLEGSRPAKHAPKPNSRYIETVSGGSFT
jgi:hypothetical protein